VTTTNSGQENPFGLILGKAQRAVALVAICVLVPSVLYAVVAARSCTGLGCTSSLAAIVVASVSFAFALLLIPAIGWLKGKPWALVLNLVMLLPLIAAGLLSYAVLHDIAQASQSRPHDIGLGTNVATQDLPVMESTIEYIINEMSPAQPLPILERTLDYGHEDHPSTWEGCMAGEGLRPELVKDFRRKAHNSVLVPQNFGADIGVVMNKPTGDVSEAGLFYAFTRPGFSSDNSQALIYVEARAPMDGWGTHYLLDHVGTEWKVVRAFCGWMS
jgi:hypothetical protein